VPDYRLFASRGSGEIPLLVGNLLDTECETVSAFPRPGRNHVVSYSREF
jgi:hypothetical protein